MNQQKSEMNSELKYYDLLHITAVYSNETSRHCRWKYAITSLHITLIPQYGKRVSKCVEFYIWIFLRQGIKKYWNGKEVHKHFQQTECCISFHNSLCTQQSFLRYIIKQIIHLNFLQSTDIFYLDTYLTWP
jgi:hypothetical protein